MNQLTSKFLARGLGTFLVGIAGCASGNTFFYPSQATTYDNGLLIMQRDMHIDVQFKYPEDLDRYGRQEAADLLRGYMDEFRKELIRRSKPRRKANYQI